MLVKNTTTQKKIDVILKREILSREEHSRLFKSFLSSILLLKNIFLLVHRDRERHKLRDLELTIVILTFRDCLIYRFGPSQIIVLYRLYFE